VCLHSCPCSLAGVFRSVCPVPVIMTHCVAFFVVLSSHEKVVIRIGLSNFFAEVGPSVSVVVVYRVGCVGG
jgi:hypothetical protein